MRCPSSGRCSQRDLPTMAQGMSAQARRPLDDILDPGFIGSLDAASPDELRTKLREARLEEDVLSYLRRNLHGRLDLLRAELAGRRAGQAASTGVESLAAVLADQGGSRGAGRGGLSLRAAAAAVKGVD